MAAAGETGEQTFEVREDPRIDVEPLVRRQWTESLLRLWDVVAETQDISREVGRVVERLDGEDDPLSLRGGLEGRVRDLARETSELSSRLGRLYGSIQSWVGPLSSDQTSQKSFLEGMLGTLSGEWSALSAELPGD